LEFAVKHENIKKLSAKNVSDPGAHLPSKFGEGLQRGTELLRRLRAAINGVSGRTLQQEELAELVGEPKSTLNNWLNGDGQPSPEALLRMVEMLPISRRHEILDDPDICRCRPVFEHPRLSHDPVKVSCLKTIVSKVEGLTLVQGEREASVTFVVTALGHSCKMLSTKNREVLGLDSHAPDWFVPVPNVKYFDNILHTQRLREEFEKAWPRMSNRKGSLIILNGGWSQLPDFHEKTRVLARYCHVVFSDKMQPRPVPANPAPTHILMVSGGRTASENIQVEIPIL